MFTMLYYVLTIIVGVGPIGPKFGRKYAKGRKIVVYVHMDVITVTWLMYECYMVSML